jgi:hypothetical protein
MVPNRSKTLFKVIRTYRIKQLNWYFKNTRLKKKGKLSTVGEVIYIALDASAAVSAIGRVVYLPLSS